MMMSIFLWLVFINDFTCMLMIYNSNHSGGVKFCELSKIFSRNLCITEIILLMRNSSWNFVHVPKAKALGTCTKFQLEILIINVISGIVYFRKIILESLQNISKTTPRCWGQNISGESGSIPWLLMLCLMALQACQQLFHLALQD